MIQTDKDSGCKLMTIWGLTNWPNVEATYLVWNGCGICALIDKGKFVDLHIAMRRESRWKCRMFVKDILEHCDKPIRALIEVKNKHVCNLAKNMGFYHVDTYPFQLFDGTLTEVIEMRY